MGLLLVLVMVACSSTTTPTVTRVAIDQEDSTVAVGDELTLTVSVVVPGGAPSSVTWSSSHVDVAAVSMQGIVTALAPGTVTITATSTFDTSKSDTVQVTVHEPGGDGTTVTVLWTDQFGTNWGEIAAAVAVDWQDHVVVVGYTEGALEGQTSQGLVDAYVRKYDPAGQEEWTVQFGTNRNDYARGVAVDSSNDVVVVGDSAGGLAGGYNVFVRKFGGVDGDELWPEPVTASGIAYAVAIDSHGDVVVVGHLLRPDRETDVFVSKFDGADGEEIWTEFFGTSELDYAVAVAVDAEDNILVVGHTWGGLGPEENLGSSDAFVIKVSGSDGSEIWTEQFGTDGEDYAAAVAVDSEAHVVVAGFTQGELTGGGEHRGEGTAFVRKLNGVDGTAAWTVQFGASVIDAAHALAVDGDDHVVAAGVTGGALVMGKHRGLNDAFVVKLSGADGASIWQEQFGTDQYDHAYGVAVDSASHVAVVGYVYGALVTGGHAGGSDAFVRKYGP